MYVEYSACMWSTVHVCGVQCMYVEYSACMRHKQYGRRPRSCHRISMCTTVARVAIEHAARGKAATLTTDLTQPLTSDVMMILHRAEEDRAKAWLMYILVSCDLADVHTKAKAWLMQKCCQIIFAQNRTPFTAEAGHRVDIFLLSTPVCHVFLCWKTTGRLERGQNSPSSQEELPLTHQPLPTN